MNDPIGFDRTNRFAIASPNLRVDIGVLMPDDRILSPTA
jgi:hypothetical protein